MRGKLVFVVGAAVGYVLGARAGRKRYEQIKSGADKVWNSPTVQKRVEQVQSFVDDHAPDVQAKVVDGAKKVADQAKRTVQRGQQKPSGGSGASGGSASRTQGTSQPTAAGDLPPFE